MVGHRRGGAGKKPGLSMGKLLQKRKARDCQRQNVPKGGGGARVSLLNETTTPSISKGPKIAADAGLLLSTILQGDERGKGGGIIRVITQAREGVLIRVLNAHFLGQDHSGCSPPLPLRTRKLRTGIR